VMNIQIVLPRAARHGALPPVAKQYARISS
jgi:hypothetical protein